MNKKEIEKYEYCKKHLGFIEEIKNKIPFGIQKYGCGTGRPNIEYSLEKIHNKMYEDVFKAIAEAKETIEKIVEEI